MTVLLLPFPVNPWEPLPRWIVELMEDLRRAELAEQHRLSVERATALRASPYPAGRKPYDWNAGLPKNIVELLKRPATPPSC